MSNHKAADATTRQSNVDHAVVSDFGDEWQRFDQSALTDSERKSQFEGYFSLFPWDSLPQDAVGFDAGCGSGRWATLVAPRVAHLHCVDPSGALEVARKNLESFQNCSFHRVTIDDMPFADDSMDFGYSLGVLHHLPDTQRGVRDCVRKLKSGSPFLVYLYYAFDNQPVWFRSLWKASDIVRRVICRLPAGVKYFLSQIIALAVYYPLARMALGWEKMGFPVHSWPLSAYRDRSLYSMRTDALDRFGTTLEKRFTRRQIQHMLEAEGLERVQFSSHPPFYCAVGYKK